MGIDRYHRTGHPCPVYLIPFDDQVVLTDSEEVLTGVTGDAHQLHSMLHRALTHHPPPLTLTGATTDDTDDDNDDDQREGYEAVFLEERETLIELKRLAKQTPDLIAEFKTGDLAVADQIGYAHRLMHIAEVLAVHATAREWITRQ